MSEPEVTEELLEWLGGLSAAGAVAPWRAMLEGRDHLCGDDFIMVGEEDDRTEDIYVSRDSGPATGIDLDLIAAARNYLPALIGEIRRLRDREQRSNC